MYKSILESIHSTKTSTSEPDADAFGSKNVNNDKSAAAVLLWQAESSDPNVIQRDYFSLGLV